MVLLALTVAAKGTLSPVVTVTQIALGFVYSCFFSHHFPPTRQPQAKNEGRDAAAAAGAFWQPVMKQTQTILFQEQQPKSWDTKDSLPPHMQSAPKRSDQGR